MCLKWYLQSEKNPETWRLVNLKSTASAPRPGSFCSCPLRWKNTFLNPSSAMQTANCRTFSLYLPCWTFEKTQLLKQHLAKQIHRKKLEVDNQLIQAHYCSGLGFQKNAKILYFKWELK